MIVAIRAERETLALRPSGPGEQFEVVQWTLQLAVDADGTVLGQAVRVVAVRAVETRRFRLNNNKLLILRLKPFSNCYMDDCFFFSKSISYSAYFSRLSWRILKLVL